MSEKVEEERDPIEAMIELASKVLEMPGYVVRTAVYKRWVVGPSAQGQQPNYAAFLLPE